MRGVVALPESEGVGNLRVFQLGYWDAWWWRGVARARPGGQVMGTASPYSPPVPVYPFTLAASRRGENVFV
jgi:hypothetical protein